MKEDMEGDQIKILRREQTYAFEDTSFYPVMALQALT